jgi:membrane dipeptidase
VGAQFWSVQVPSRLPEPQAVVSALEQIDAVYRLIARHPQDLRVAYTAADVECAFADGRIASLLGVEGAHSAAGSPGVLRAFARLGVRCLTLTDDDGAAGAVVAELNRVGIVVDLSHTAESTQRAALATTVAPVLFGHPATHAVGDDPRAVADPVLDLLRANGGVIQLTLVPDFVSAVVGEWAQELRAERQRLELSADPQPWPRSPGPGEDPALVAKEYAESLAEPVDDRLLRWLTAHPRPGVTTAQVADHVERAREATGVEHIGLGGGHGGTGRPPTGPGDACGYPVLLGELAVRGWSGSDLEALTGRNVLRVLRDAEECATEPLWPTAPLS